MPHGTGFEITPKKYSEYAVITTPFDYSVDSKLPQCIYEAQIWRHLTMKLAFVPSSRKMIAVFRLGSGPLPRSLKGIQFTYCAKLLHYSCLSPFHRVPPLRNGCQSLGKNHLCLLKYSSLN